MSLRYRYVTKGHLSQKELEGLNRLCREEEDVKWAMLNSDVELSSYYRRLLTYSKVNKFKLSDLGNAPSDKYKEYKNKYNFILAKDKQNNLLGYLCFEHILLNTDEEIKDLIIIKHMYISNAANHTNIDNTLFYILENIVSKCIVFSDKLYRPCNQFNGFSLMTEPFGIKESKAIKFKKSNRFPAYENITLKAIVHTMGDFSKYANVDRLN